MYSKVLYEDLIKRVCGDNWRNGDDATLNSAWGVAIVQSVLDGVSPDLQDISEHLGIEKRIIKNAYNLLSLNGVFLRDRIFKDKHLLERGDKIAWGYYAGYAAGVVGPFRPKY